MLPVVVQLGLDYAFGRPGGQAIVDNGYTFVLRYVPYPGDQGKGLTKAEINEYRPLHLKIGLVFESTAGRMFDGYPAGVQDALTCQNAIVNLGLPTNMVFYFACDVDTNPGMLAYVDDYLRGASSILGLECVGIYGEYDVVKHCYLAGTATWLWQTYAWSGGLAYGYRHLYQYKNGQILNGAEVDLNEAYGINQGLWGFEQEEDEDMSVASENFKIATWCTNEEVRDLKAGNISRTRALELADSRTAALLAADEPLALADTLYSHLVVPHTPAGGLVPHVHEAGITGPADPT